MPASVISGNASKWHILTFKWESPLAAAAVMTGAKQEARWCYYRATKSTQTGRQGSRMVKKKKHWTVTQETAVFCVTNSAVLLEELCKHLGLLLTMHHVFFCSSAEILNCDYEFVLYLQCKQKTFLGIVRHNFHQINMQRQMFSLFSINVSGCCLTDVFLYSLWINIMKIQQHLGLLIRYNKTQK